MKKFLIPLIPLLFFSVIANTQVKPEDSKDRIEAMKVSFITSKLKLTTDEAQRFWPLYNEYQEELGNTNRKKDMTREDFEAMSDKEAESLLNDFVNNEKKKAEVKAKYADKISSILGAKRTIRFFHSENTFKKEVLKNYKERYSRRMGGDESPPRKRNN